jgi:hypothetical protein
MPPRRKGCNFQEISRRFRTSLPRDAAGVPPGLRTGTQLARHTMLDDSDIASTRHARAFVCGALAAVIGHAEIYVSGGAEHQGPDGGGPVALIVDRGETVMAQ